MSDLFIRGKTYSDFAMLNLSRINKDLHCGNDFSNSGFVIRSEQCCSIGGDQVKTNAFFQFRKFGRIKSNPLFFIDDQGFAVIITYDLWLYILP